MRMKEYVNLILAFVLLFGVLLGATLPTPTSAGLVEPGNITPTEIEPYPEEGIIRLSPTATTNLTYQWVDYFGNEKHRYTTTISSLPQTLSDLTTPIATDWIAGMAIDGVGYYDTKNNLFHARVTGTMVSAEMDGKMCVWNPDVFLGDYEMKLRSGPKVVPDPINPYYQANTIEWVYEATFKSGWWIFSSTDTITITRYLRQIEGMLLEYYILTENPEYDVRIVSNYNEDAGFVWEKPITAYDAAGLRLEIYGDGNEKVVPKEELAGKYLVYPVTIDPTLAFDQDQHGQISLLSHDQQGYAWVRESEYGYPEYYTYGAVGQYYSGEFHEYPYNYAVTRYMTYFDTSDIPDTATITTADLILMGDLPAHGSSDNFYVTIQSGMPDYPHEPLNAYDFDYTKYSGDGGSLYSLFWDDDGENIISLSATGRSWINREGMTKFCLRSSKDIDATAPTAYEYVKFHQHTAGEGLAPELEVTYTVVVVAPTVSTQAADEIDANSATLHGTLTDDGGAACSVRFKHGLTAGYGSTTSWIDGKTTGQTWEQSIYGLTEGTLYHYTAQAQNSGGTSTDSDVTFLTLPDPPTGFTNTPGDTEMTLNWTKGTGSGKTHIRRATGGYPATREDGTQVYFDTGVGVVDTSLTNGVAYYYRAWAEITSGGHQQYSSSGATTVGTPYTSGPPEVTTYDTTDVGTTTATLQGYLNSLGGYAEITCLFQWYHGAGTWTDNEPVYGNLTAVGPFEKNITGLPTDTEIHVRASAWSEGGIDYGLDVPFTTGAPSAPSMATNAETGVSKTSATLWGEILDYGDNSAVTVWFEWGETTAYGEETGTTIMNESEHPVPDADFYVTLTGLDPGTTYHYRAVGQVSGVGTGYGDDEEFATDSPDTPEVTTQAATDIGATSAMLEGLLNSDGGVSCEVRFQWGINDTLTDSCGWMPGYTSGQGYEWLATSLAVGSNYTFRAEAKNSAGTAVSFNLTFTTVFTRPSDFQAVALSRTAISLSWTRIGDKTLVRGKVGAFPANRLDGESVYFGTAEATTHGNLQPGTTYFYRAWSWRGNDTYSAQYAEDAATTWAGTPPGAPEYPDIAPPRPDAPSWWWQTPSGRNIPNWPGVSLAREVASDLGMSPAAMCMLVAGVILMAVGIAAFTMTNSALATLCIIAVAIFFLTRILELPGWMIMTYVFLAGGLMYAKMKA